MIEYDVLTRKTTITKQDEETEIEQRVANLEPAPHEPTIEERLQATEEALLTLLSMGVV
jgi:hypothetical protein